jgi:hypothetical protein
MRCPDDLGLLRTQDFSRIQDLCDQLEAAWQALKRPSSGVDLEPILPAAGTELRLAALYELIKTDMPLRCANGLEWDLNYYARKFPELGGPEEFSARLIFEEWLVRKRHGLPVLPAEFRRRFPRQFPELERRVREQEDSPMQTPALPEGKIQPAWRASPANARLGQAANVVSSTDGTIAPNAAGIEALLQSDQPPPKSANIEANAAARTVTFNPAGTPRNESHRDDTPAFFAKLRPGIAIRNLTLLRKLGEGSYADVWKVLDTEGGVEKAIRIVKTPLKSEEARAELTALASYKNLRHPFLLHTDSAFEVEQQLIIVMELVEGGSLRDRFKELRRAGEKGMEPFPLLGYIAEVAQVLDYLHGKNILHRDIKPDNILLGKERYHVKVADLGLVKLSQADADTSTLAGTPAYIAPEVWKEQGCYRASDQYSLAATYAELRQGEIASRGGVSCLKRDRLGTEEFTVIQRALAQDPDQRYCSCTAFVKALEAAVRVDAIPPEPVLWTNWCRRQAPWALLATVALCTWGIISCDWNPDSGENAVEKPVIKSPAKDDGFDLNKFTLTP